jgi:hypothetical protein
MTDVPYDELDPPIVELVPTLNSFPGVNTLGSCGGHEPPTYDGQTPGNQWWITFELESHDPALVAVPTPEAWVSLEFLAWLIHHDASVKAGSQIELYPDALPPFLNFPGRMLRFAIEGDRDGERGIDPDELARSIEEAAGEYYVPADEAWPIPAGDPFARR